MSTRMTSLHCDFQSQGFFCFFFSEEKMFSKLSLIAGHRLPHGSLSVDCAVCSGALGAQEVTGDLFVTSGLSQTTSCLSRARLKRLRCFFFPPLPCWSLLVGWSRFAFRQFVCGLTFHQVVEVAVVGALVSDHVPVFRDGHGLQAARLEQNHTEGMK